MVDRCGVAVELKFPFGIIHYKIETTIEGVIDRLTYMIMDDAIEFCLETGIRNNHLDDNKIEHLQRKSVGIIEEPAWSAWDVKKFGVIFDFDKGEIYVELLTNLDDADHRIVVKHIYDAFLVRLRCHSFMCVSPRELINIRQSQDNTVLQTEKDTPCCGKDCCDT